MMACDIEFCLLNIIMYCNPDPNNHERVGQFRGMKMSAKINNVISDVKKYRPECYIEFKDAFDGLEEFRIVRNDMAHYKGQFKSEDDLSVFKITFVDKDETAQERIYFKEYTSEYIQESVIRFAKINGDLSALWIRLYSEYNKRLL